MADELRSIFWNQLRPWVQGWDFLDNLQARVSDPMWMLGHQWQRGEFQGEDAGSLVDTKMVVTVAPMVKFKAKGDSASGDAVPYLPPKQPLEALVERELVRTRSGDGTELRTAAEAGAHFLRLLAAQSIAAPALSTYRQAFINTYPMAAPGAAVDPASRRFAKMMVGRVPDGFKMVQALRPILAAPSPVLPPALGIAPGDAPAVIAAGRVWLTWWDQLISEAPGEESTWVDERLEHRFDVGVQLYSSTGTKQQEIVLAVDEYPGGRLDWSSFDFRPGETMSGVPSDDSWAQRAITYEGLPTPIEFNGMPNPRVFEMEDRKLDLSRIEPAADDLGRMILMEFALVYSNDWHLIPMEAPVGTVLRVASLEVTDTFGTKLRIKASPAVGDSNDEWGMYQVSPRLADGTTVLSPPANEPVFLLPPVLGQFQQGEPIEEVHFLRDEMANLAWAVERIVPSPLGDGLDRLEEEKQQIRDNQGTPWADLAVGELAQYQLATRVPSFWIPLLPVPTVAGGRQNRFVGGRMLNYSSQPPTQIPPKGTILQNRVVRPPITPLYAFNEAEVTTLSGTYTNSNCETAALANNVDYLVIYGASGSNDLNTGFSDIRLIHGTTTLAEAGLEASGGQPGLGQKNQGFLRVKGNGTATLRLQFKTRDGLVARVDGQYIIAVPLDGLVEGVDFFHTGTTAATDERTAQSATTWNALRTADGALGPIPNGEYIVLMSCEARFSASGTDASGFMVGAQLNGAPLFPTGEVDNAWQMEWEDNTDVASWAVCGLETLSQGPNNTASIRVKSRGAANTAWRRSNIWLFRTAAFEQVVQKRATTGGFTIFPYATVEYTPLNTQYRPNQTEDVIVLTMAQTGQSLGAFGSGQEIVLSNGEVRATRSGQGYRDVSTTDADNWPITMAAVDRGVTPTTKQYRVTYGVLGTGVAHINRKRNQTDGPVANLIVWSMTRSQSSEAASPSLPQDVAHQRPFRVWEEEIPRAGAHVTRRYEYTRWNDGSSHLWVGRRKRPGLGEGSSRLEFDRVVDGSQATSQATVDEANTERIPVSPLRAFNDTEFVTNNSNYVDSNCQTVVLDAAVDYLVMYGANCANDVTTGFCDIRLMQGTTVLGEAGMRTSGVLIAAQGQKQQGFVRATGNGSTTLRLQTRSRSGINARVRGQYIVAIPLDNLVAGEDYFHSGSPVATDERSNQSASAWSMLRTVTGIPDGEYLVLMSCEGRFSANGSAASACMVRARKGTSALFPTGETDDAYQVVWADNSDSFCWASLGVETLSGGVPNSVSIEVKSRGAANTAWRRSNIWLFKTSVWEQIKETRATTGASTTTAYPNVEFAALRTTYAPERLQDVVLLSVAQTGHSTASNVTLQELVLRDGTTKRATRSGQGFRDISANGDNWPITMATVDTGVPEGATATYKLNYGQGMGGTAHINKKRNDTDGPIARLIAWGMTIIRRN